MSRRSINSAALRPSDALSDNSINKAETSSKTAAKYNAPDFYATDDAPFESTNQLLGDEFNNSEVPDMRIDLRQCDKRRSFFSDDEDHDISHRKKRKVEGTDEEFFDEQLLISQSTFNLPSSPVASVSLEDGSTCSSFLDAVDLLSQSSDLDSMTLESLICAGTTGHSTGDFTQNECDTGEVVIPVNRENTDEDDDSDPEYSQLSLADSTNSLNTEFNGDISVDDLVNLESLQSVSERFLTNPLIRVSQNTEPSNLLSPNRTATSIILEQTNDSFESLSLYSNSVPSSQDRVYINMGTSQDHLVPTSSEDELTQRLEAGSRSRRELLSCHAQVVPDCVHYIEE